jgi:hypothetical protein
MKQENKPKAEPVKFPGTVRRILPLFPSLWLIPITMLFMVFAIILPMFQRPRLPAKTIVCRTNLKQISLGVTIYSNDNDGAIPTAEKWNDLIFEYIADERPHQCPSIGKQAPKTCAYILNRNLYDLKTPIPGDMVLAFEGPVGWNQTGGAEMMVFRHGTESVKCCNVALFDGSVTNVTEDEAAKLKWKGAVAD